MTIKAEGKGFRLYSKSDPTKALGPVRKSEKEVLEKDEKRVQMFKHKTPASKPSSLAPASSKKAPKPVKDAGKSKGEVSALPSVKAAKARRGKTSMKR